jgi:hypothetical protein
LRRAHFRLASEGPEKLIEMKSWGAGGSRLRQGNDPSLKPVEPETGNTGEGMDVVFMVEMRFF